MIHIVQETTQWKCGYAVNHIYFLDSRHSKMFAYINSVTGESKIFSKPIGFDKRDRTFDIIEKRKLA